MVFLRMSLLALGGFLLCFLLIFLLSDRLVAYFAFHPTKHPSGETLLIKPVEEVFFNTNDNLRLHAYYLKNAESNKVILYFHGNAGNAYDRLPDALEMHRRGFNVFLLNYRGYGKSQGIPSELGVYSDAEAALKLLVEELNYEYSDIYVLGRSIGGAVAINVAQHKPLGGLILVTPLLSGREMARQTGMSWLLMPGKTPFNSLGKLKNISSPMLFIHGDRDQVIPIKQGKALYEAYKGRKFFRLVKGGDHNDLVYVAGASYWNWIEQFIK